MKISSLHEAHVQASNFRLSPQPHNNKALAEENANLRTKVAQLMNEKEQWQIKYCSLNMKVLGCTKYNNKVQHLLGRMCFYLKNFLIVHDMLDHFLQQEVENGELGHYNTTTKQKTNSERVSKELNIELLGEEEQQQQQIPESQVQNTTINHALQLSWMHNKTLKSVSEMGEKHHLQHEQNMTGYQSNEIQQYDQTVDFAHGSQENNAGPVTEEIRERKLVQNVEQEEFLVNQTWQKSKLPGKMQEHQEICLNLSSENASLMDYNSFTKKSPIKEQLEQLSRQNAKHVSLHQCHQSCSLEYESPFWESQQHKNDHLLQMKNGSYDKNLKLDHPHDQDCDNISKALESIEASQRKSTKTKHFPVVNDNQHDRDQGLSVGNREISIQTCHQRPVKLCYLFPEKYGAVPLLQIGQNSYLEKGKQLSTESDQQSHSAEHREKLTPKRYKQFALDQEHLLMTSEEQGTTNKQRQFTIIDQQHQFVTGQQQCSESNKLHQGVENESQKVTNKERDKLAPDEELTLKSQKKKQFDKEAGMVHKREQTKQFSGQHRQKINVEQMPQLITRYEQRLSHEQPLLEQGQQQKQPVKQTQQLQGKQSQQCKGEQAQQLAAEEIKVLAISNCWSGPEDCQQPAMEQIQPLSLERVQQPLAKQVSDLSAELRQQIPIEKFQDTVAKEVKWLAAEQSQWLVPEKEWNLKVLQGQQTHPHHEIELQEHSSIYLLSELSNTGFESSWNSSTQSLLRHARKYHQKTTMNNTAFHISFTDDSIIKIIPVNTEAFTSKTLDQYKHFDFLKAPCLVDPDELCKHNERPRRKCTIGVNYCISP